MKSANRTILIAGMGTSPAVLTGSVRKHQGIWYTIAVVIWSMCKFDEIQNLHIKCTKRIRLREEGVGRLYS